MVTANTSPPIAAEPSTGQAANGIDNVAPSKWDDPSVPVGNAPPMPRWPVFAWAVAWTLWIVFLVAMAWA